MDAGFNRYNTKYNYTKETSFRLYLHFAERMRADKLKHTNRSSTPLWPRARAPEVNGCGLRRGPKNHVSSGWVWPRNTGHASFATSQQKEREMYMSWYWILAVVSGLFLYNLPSVISEQTSVSERERENDYTCIILKKIFVFLFSLYTHSILAILID